MTVVLRRWMEPNLDELGPLLRLRHQAEEDRRFTLPRLRDLDRRIAAHLEALSFYAPADLVVHDDPLAVAAALIAAGADAGEQISALEPTEVEALARQGSSAVRGDGPRVALIAGRVPEARWFTADDPWLRRWAWLLGGAPAPTADGEPDPLVRDALRRRHPGWRGGPPAEDLAWQARLATPAEAPTLAARLWALDPPPFAALAALGRPADARELIAFLAHPDPQRAVAAGRAFTVLTGADIDSDRRVALVDPDEDPADAFAAEFRDEAWLPDPARARAAAERLPAGPRINRGVIVDDANADADERIDAFEAASARLRRARMR